ncbi:MAG: GDP-mannose 4,6-dehydratase [Candidatus Woesearchaeota archaeon]
MKKAIVFGINGMDARTITRILLNLGYQVVGTYRRNTLNLKDEVCPLYEESDRLAFEFCNIADFDSVRSVINKHNNVDEIYLLAAQSHVGFSFLEPEQTVITNGMSAFNVLENVKNLAPKSRVYFSATSELLGGDNPEKPYDENSPYDCRSPYSIGKELGTRWVKYYRQMGIFACYGVLFNHSNVLRSKDFFIRKVTNAAAKIKLGKQSHLELGNLDFYRDEHWSDFGCEMMVAMLNNDEPKDYIIANGKTNHGLEYLNNAFGYFGLDWKKYVEINESLFRPNEVVKLIGDSSLAQKDLGWIPNRMSFQEHIEIMCEWDYKLESGEKPIWPEVFKLFPR